MAIGFRSVGTVSENATGTSIPAPGRPSGMQGNDLLIMLVGTKAAVQPTITTPTGFTAPSNNAASGGAGTAGVDTGPVRISLFYRFALTATDTIPSITVSTAGSPQCAVCIAFHKSDNETWDVPLCAIAGDTTGSTTSYDPAAAAITLALGAGDMIVASDWINGDAGTPTVPGTLTVTGVTLGSLSNVHNAPVTSGNDGRLMTDVAQFVSGTASAGPDRSVTYSGANANMGGATVFYRLRTTQATQLPGPEVVTGRQRARYR